MRPNKALVGHYERGGYDEHTSKFIEKPRESQKEILAILKRHSLPQRLRFLDAGCGPGNFLPHIEREFPLWETHGLELSKQFIESARNNPAIKRTTFHYGDLTDPSLSNEHGLFDVIVVHAVFSNLDMKGVRVGIANISRLLARNGLLIVFEWIQNTAWMFQIALREKEDSADLVYQMHSLDTFKDVFKPHGIEIESFAPFKIGIDLPNTGPLTTHTKRLESGDRIQFVGDWYQPWHFIVAKKRSDGWIPEPDEDEFLS